MSYQDRKDANEQQKLNNEGLIKTLRRGLTLLPKDESDFPPFRVPFLFVPTIPIAPTTAEGNPAGLSQSSQQAGNAAAAQASRGTSAVQTLSNVVQLGASIARIYQTLISIIDQFPLILEVPPHTIDYSMEKAIEQAPTMGGYVQYHWGEQLDNVQAQQSTGAFMNLEAGLSEGVDRRVTFSYIIFERLLALYRNNGAIYTENGMVRAFTGLRMINDWGIFAGYFDTFTVNESAEKPFTFTLNWNFKVTRVIHTFVSL